MPTNHHNAADLRPLVVSREEAARMLGGITERTLDIMTRRGELPAVRVGKRRVMYEVSALEEYIASKRIQ